MSEDNILYSNDLYDIRLIGDALDEDGRGRVDGYGIFNKNTGVREATGLVFGECRWRADQFANMVRELDARAEEEGDPITVDAGEDVVLN